MAIIQNADCMTKLRQMSDELAAAEDKVAWRMPDGRMNAAVALPVILPRLEQKDAEWKEVGALVCVCVCVVRVCLRV